MKNVIYIMGTGRSGTTILEVLLKNHSKIDGVGELTHFYRDGIERRKLCSCGKHVDNCDVWSLLTPNQTCVINEEEANILKRLDSHRLFLKVWSREREGSEEKNYRKSSQAIFGQLSKATNVDYLIDSSKYPSRALMLKRCLGTEYELFVIAVTRNWGDLVNAFRNKNIDEQKPKNPLQVTVYFIAILMMMALVKIKLNKPVIKIRYEDLRIDPEEALKSILETIGLQEENVVTKLVNNDKFEVGHILTGNRLRYDREVRFMRSNSNELSIGRRSVLSPIFDLYRWLLGF